MRDMRRKDKQIADPAGVAELLARAAVCRLGFSAAEGVCDYPYVIPVHFTHHEGTIYVHCAEAGLKLDLLRRDPRVCVEVDELRGIVPADKPCAFSTRYASLIAFGRARLVSDPATRRLALSRLMEKYAGTSQPAAGWTDRQLAGVAVIAVTVEHITGKRSGEP
jgi:nitroimidazol reductase NimA-like FMN-containing flavoprotein (pyridoxamine 5'-phosphate oxidase superfamily)